MSRLKFIFKSLAVFCICFILIAAVIAARPLSLSEPPLFNPSRGFSMAVLLFGGIKFAIPLVLASSLANFYFLKHGIEVSAFLAFNNFVSMWVGALLVKKFCRGQNPAKDPKDWAIFVFGVVPVSLMIRFALDAFPLRIFNPNHPIHWAELYSQWIWIDALGLILAFPFFMEVLNLWSEKKHLREITQDLIPFLIGNFLGIFVFFDPHFEKVGLPKYLSFYFALIGLIGISYFVNPFLVSLSVFLQGLGADWSREGVLLSYSSESQSELWDVRFFLFVIGIITPVLSSLLRKGSEDPLQKSFSLVSSALNSTNNENDLIRVASKSDTVAVGVFDMNYRVLHLNEKFAEIAGTPLESQIGQTSKERIGPNSRHMAEVFEKIKKTGKPIWNYRLRFEAWQHMRQQDRLVNYIPIFARNEEVVGVIVVSTEILDSANKEKVLKGQIDSNADQGERNLLNIAISHDLQEPLRNVNQALKILNEKFKTSADFELKSFVESALDASSKVHSMLKGSLELSRLDHEKPELHKVNFQALVQEILVRYRTQLNELGAQVHVESSVEISADKELLYRIVQNLLSNSIKYRTHKSLVVKVSSSVQGEMCQFRFSDNGIGFNNKDIVRIFAPYQRLHSEKEIEGYGLGLPICKKIVELHGGKMWAESKPGEGATFYFTLPVA